MLSGPRGVALCGAREVGSGDRGAGASVVGSADDAGRLAEVCQLAAELAGESRYPHPPTELELRCDPLLLRDSAPSDQLAQLPGRFQRFRASERDAYRRREGFREELQELVLRRVHSVLGIAPEGQFLNELQKFFFFFIFS